MSEKDINALTVPKLKEIIVTNNLQPEKGPKRELVQAVVNFYKESNSLLKWVFNGIYKCSESIKN